jgi:hypothetical protein
MRRLLLAGGALTALVGGTLALTLGLAGGREADPCGHPDTRVQASDLRSRDLVVVQRRQELVVVPAAAAGPRAHIPVGTDGVLWGVAARPGAVAVIEDRKGPDRLLVLDGAGVHRFDEGAELGPPAWSPAGRLTYVAGSSTLVIRDGDVVLRFGPPPGALSIHSPAFPDDSAPVVVAEEPVAGYSGHDTALNNLWRLDLTTGTWSRLTDFRAAGDDWIAIRTPVARTDGSLAFVVIGGNARDGQMRPGLWTWAPQSGARHERDLAGQFFLAGVVGQELLWNFLDDDLQWRLGTLAPDGDFHQIACGRVLVDPQDVTDPDLESAVPESVPDPSVEAAGPSAPVGVIVGDFDSRREAANVARRLGAKLGPVRVVGHDDAPLAIAPGKWGAVWVVPPATPPDAAKQLFNDLFPEYEASSWVVSLFKP